MREKPLAPLPGDLCSMVQAPASPALTAGNSCTPAGPAPDPRLMNAERSVWGMAEPGLRWEGPWEGRSPGSQILIGGKVHGAGQQLLRTGIALCLCQTLSHQRPGVNNAWKGKTQGSLRPAERLPNPAQQDTVPGPHLGHCRDPSTFGALGGLAPAHSQEQNAHKQS